MKYYVESYGCTMNFGEGRVLSEYMASMGHFEVCSAEEADIIILNTCTVVETTEKHMLSRISELKKQGKDLIVTGCMAKAQPHRIEIRLPDSPIIPPEDYNQFTDRIVERYGIVGDPQPIKSTVDAILPIAQGCLGNCSYCITKFARGDLHSYSHDELVERFKRFVEQGSKEDLFYKTNNWKEGIKINHDRGHHGNNDWRDAFSGKQAIEVIRYGSIAEPTSGEILLRRPLGKYIFVTNDLEDFVTKVMRTKAEEAEKAGETKVPEFDLDDYTLTIVYTGFMPSSYSMVTDRANDSEVNVRFTSKLRQVNENYAIMGFDYVLANPETATQTNVIMGIELKDKDGTVLASHPQVRVPLNRSEYTVIEGRFLMQESSGGITLNPDFEGEFVVPVY